MISGRTVSEGEHIDRPSPLELLEAIIDRSGYAAELEAERSLEATGRLENIAELVGNTQEFDGWKPS